MKTNLLLTSAILLVSSFLYSQSLPDSSFTKKNEISVDLIPVIKVLSGANDGADKGTLQYKRQLNKKMFLRVGFTAIQQDHQAYDYSNIIRTFADSLHDGIQYNRDSYKPELQLNVGLEYRWGKRRLKQFAGLDIGYAHNKTVHTEFYTTIPRFSDFSPNENYHTDTIVSSYSTIKNGINLSPFYGLYYPITKKIFFSAQVGFQMGIYRVKNNAQSNGKPYIQSNVTEFNFNGSFLNNFSIGYRF